MFDEMNEGTAILKTAATSATSPQEAQMVTLDADGCDLTSDWYLQVAGAVAKNSTVLALGLGSPPTENFPLSLKPTLFPIGTKLNAGSKLKGPGLTLSYLTDGDLTVTDVYGEVLWDTGTTNRNCTSGCVLSFQGDGNLVLYQSGKAYWSSASAFNETGVQATKLLILDHLPYVEIVSASNDILWSSTANFSQGFSLSKGEFVQLGNATSNPAHLKMGTDGNLTLYSGFEGQPGTHKILWSTDKTEATCNSGGSATFQGDGNFVVYNGSKAIFATNTVNKIGEASLASRLQILNASPYLEVTDSGGHILWSAVH